ncbi:MAG: lipopolysaccharide biosynthesis protein [Hyphomicrobiaceae bacterium]
MRTFAQLTLFFADKRVERLKLAMLASIATKFTRLFTQTFVVAIAIRHLGAEPYGMWLTVLAALGWLSWGQAGLAPGLVNAIAMAEGQDQQHDQGIYFTTALVLTTTITVFLLIAGFAVVDLSYTWSTGFGETNRSGWNDADTQQWLVFAKVGLVILLLRIPIGLIESAYVGLQKIHILRSWEIAGQIFSLSAALALAYSNSTPAMFLLAVGLIGELGFIAAAIHLVTKLHPQLRPTLKKFDIKASRQMFSLSGGYFMIQIAGYLVAHAGTLVLAAYHSPAAVPVFVLTWQLYQMASGIWMMLVTGMWGTFGEAHGRKEWSWIQNGQQVLITTGMALSVCFSVVLVIWGEHLLRLWSGDQVEGDQTFFIVMALNCSLFTWAILHAQILSALGQVWKQFIPAMANGILMVALSFLLVPKYGATGLATALFIASAATTAWAYPMMLSELKQKNFDVAA